MPPLQGFQTKAEGKLQLKLEATVPVPKRKILVFADAIPFPVVNEVTFHLLSSYLKLAS